MRFISLNGFRNNADKEQQIYVEKIFDFANMYHKSPEFVDVLYLRVFISMQRCVSQKFFNNKNTDGLIKRWMAANRFFANVPFSKVYEHVDFRTLNKNSKIKYILFRLKLYGVMNAFRSIYNRMNGKEMMNRKAEERTRRV